MLSSGIMPNKRRRLDTSNNPNEIVIQRRAGNILSMTLRNFMCHSLLKADFSKNNINIVTGNNGSGKSAILTALIIGLGGRATLTNRGTGVSSLIKKGKLSGSIEIVLYNCGTSAYQHDKFGDSIIIMRNLNSCGSGSYKIKSSAGQVISTLAKELQNITFYFNIQIDNPICILTQDTSRNFLNSSDGKNKFILFMKASKLEVLEDKLKQVVNDKEELEIKLSDKKKKFLMLQETVGDLKRKIVGHQSMAKLKENTITLQKELMWIEVNDKEKELQSEHIKLDENMKKLNEFENKKEAHIKQYETFKQTLCQLEKEIEQLSSEIESQEQSQEEMKRSIDRLQSSLTEKRLEQHKIQSDIKFKSSHAENLKKDIANFTQQLSEAELNKKKRMDYLQDIKQKLNDLEADFDKFYYESLVLGNEINKTCENENALQSELTAINASIKHSQSNLATLQNQPGNALAFYGRYMPALVSLINQRKNLFSQLPRGPLGSYITVKNQKWTLAVESCLGGGLLSAFVVDNQKDAIQLRKLFEQIFDRREDEPTLITAKFFFKKHDVHVNLVRSPSDCVSMYDILQIDDPVVSNCIVDQMSIENLLLIPSIDRAMELLSEESNVPRNCKLGITIEGDQCYPSPNYRFYSSTWRRAKFLHADTKEQTKFIEEKISELKNKQQSIRNQLSKVQNELHQQKEKKKTLEIQIQKINAGKIEVRKQIKELDSEVSLDVHNINYFQDELNETNNIINEKTKNLQIIEENIKKMETELEQSRNQFNSEKNKTKSTDEKRWNLKLQFTEKKYEEHDMQRVTKYQTTQLQEIKNVVKSLEKQIASKQLEIDKMSTSASEFSERPNQFRNKADVLQDIKDTNETIATFQRESMNLEEISVKYKQLCRKSKSISEIVKKLQESLDELYQSVQSRNRHYKLTEKYFISVIKYTFQKMLEYRHFKGDIDINMNEKTLDLIVIPQGIHQTAATNLSGGEKSYATVGFLYALWHCMDFPFYFLDEFDVFMDKLNRTKVIQALIRHAKLKPDLQFVFLTPQDVSFIGEDVSVFKLQDPVRMLPSTQ